MRSVTVTSDYDIADEAARQVVRMLMARDRMNQDDLAAVLGMSQPRVSERLRGNIRFRFAELVVLARHFHVTLDDFGPKSRFLSATGGSAWNRSCPVLALAA
jgi:transcriptional regulator with XRE-family HTH domain